MRKLRFRQVKYLTQRHTANDQANVFTHYLVVPACCYLHTCSLTVFGKLPVAPDPESEAWYDIFKKEKEKFSLKLSDLSYASKLMQLGSLSPPLAHLPKVFYIGFILIFLIGLNIDHMQMFHF